MANDLKDFLNDIEYLAACPGCNSENFSVLEPENEHEIFLTDADEMSVTTGVCGCEKCGLTFLNPRMGQRKLFEYYSKQSRIPRDSIDFESPFAVLMELQIDEIEKIKPINNNLRVLEIGCAEGFFLKSLEKRAKSKLNLYGVELSEKYIEQAKRLLPDVTIFETPLEETAFGDLKFDLVIMRHVLEHLGNPLGCLRKIRDRLAPAGVLYIEVPDSLDISPSVSRFYHHEHLLYFTNQTLKSFLRSSGMKPLVCKRFDANPVGSGFSYPVIRSVCAAGHSSSLDSFSGHAKMVYSKNKMQNTTYLDALLAPIRQRLHELKSSSSRIGLFGAGPHTMDLLQILEGENIQWSKIFDNNPTKQGKFMRGIPVVKPEERTLKSVDCVLVSSAEFEAEMVAQVLSLAGTQIEIIRIYDHDAPL